MSIEDTLKERGETHGDFKEHAFITQFIKHAMHTTESWENGRITDAMRESLDMIAHKIGRILSGDPKHPDHWHDIAGYATLVEKELTK